MLIVGQVLDAWPVGLLVVGAGFDGVVINPALDVIIVLSLIYWLVSIDGFVSIGNFGTIVVDRSSLLFEVAIAEIAIANNLFVAADNDRVFMLDLFIMVNNLVIMVYFSLSIDDASVGRNAPATFSYGAAFFDNDTALPVYASDCNIALLGDKEHDQADNRSDD